MHHVSAMRSLKSTRNLNRDRKRLLQGKRSLRQPRGQRVSFEILHYQVIDAVLMTDVVEDANMGMIRAGDGFRFAFEPLPKLGVPGKVRGQNLDSNGSIQTRIFSAIH